MVSLARQWLYRVDGLEISESNHAAHQLLVQGAREMQVEDHGVVDGQPNQPPDQAILLESDVVVEGIRVEPVEPLVLLRGKHPVLGVEHLPHQELEEFFLDTALVDALFTDELDAELLLEVLGRLGRKLRR